MPSCALQDQLQVLPSPASHGCSGYSPVNSFGPLPLLVSSSGSKLPPEVINLQKLSIYSSACPSLTAQALSACHPHPGNSPLCFKYPSSFEGKSLVLNISKASHTYTTWYLTFSYISRYLNFLMVLQPLDSIKSSLFGLLHRLRTAQQGTCLWSIRPKFTQSG